MYWYICSMYRGNGPMYWYIRPMYWGNGPMYWYIRPMHWGIGSMYWYICPMYRGNNLMYWYSRSMYRHLWLPEPIRERPTVVATSRARLTLAVPISAAFWNVTSAARASRRS